MKKIIPFALSLALLVSLFGCGGSSEQQKSKETATPSQNVETPSEKPSEQIPEETEMPAVNGAGDLGDYHVEIKGAALGEDYEGNPIIVITYSWTNNSDETKSPMWTISEKAFQDGVELDTAIVMNSDVYDSGASMKEVRPGTTIEAQCAFVMTSESIVEFEMTELISFSNEMVAMNFDPTTL